VAVAATSSVLLVVLSRHVFLFWDDFYFLGEARESDLSWGYLTDPLFRHFSPVSRLGDLVVVGAIPAHPWVILLAQSVLLTAVVASVTWLMVVLHGRSVPALVGSVVLAPSLTLVPLGNWWTAGLNILPALAGFYVAFGAMAVILRGGSRWWATAVFAGAAVGVLDYELPMLLCGYLGLWLLLFRTRVTDEPLSQVLRRSWWVWVGVIAICVAAALNYRLNYYDDTVPKASPGDALDALVRSLVGTLVPTAVGFHDPRSGVFSALSLVVGCVVLAALVGWLLATRDGAWRGLLFAAAGWLVPTLALVVSRVSLFGVSVVDNAIYFHLPTVLFVVGVLEAWRRPRRGPVTVGPGPVARRVVAPALAVAVVAAYAWSAGPTSRYQQPPGATPAFVERARASAATLLDAGDRFSVINSDVPGYVAPADFDPYNRASEVLGVTARPLDFDDPEPPYYRVSDSGELVPVDVHWLAQTTPAEGRLRLLDAQRDAGVDALCFTATDSSSVLWPLTEPLSGPDLVVRTLATAGRTTPVRVTVRTADETSGFDRANPDHHTLGPGRSGVLDTVAAPTITIVRVKGFTPGARVCLDGLAVGRVVTPGG
jgi:hypothetical protein